MAFTKVNHIGMLVDDLEGGRHVFCDGWGLAVNEHRSPWPQGRPGTLAGTTSIEIPIGEMYLEISKPNDGASAAAEFVADRRAGMYYIALASSDLVSDVRMLQEHGVTPEGAWDGEGAVFLDPATTLGLRIEVVPDQGYYPHPHFLGDGTLTGMGHVGIAARDVEEVRTLFGGAFGLHEDRSAERGLEPASEDAGSRPADDPVHLVEFAIGGTVIEISVPTTETSGTARLVQNRAPLGAVYHHVAPYAPDVHRAAERGRAAELVQIGEVPPREEGRDVHVAWFHPRSCVGTLIEIWDRPPGDEHMRQYD
ncbi:MAG: VOC family protein [Chloroflexi bacterium]|nr:VOC family protein [Chloroflexota bacterium]